MISAYMGFIKRHLGSIIVLVIVAILSIASFFIDLGKVQEFIAGAGVWAPLLYIAAKVSTVVFAPLSGTALYVFSVPLFGFWHGVTYSFIGDLIGALITFYISRLFGMKIVRYFAGKSNMEHIENALNIMSTPKGFLSMRLAALSMPEIASYAAGLTRINFWYFITIHMLVDIVPIFAISIPGLFLTHQLPAWVTVAAIASAVFVTVGSISVFAFMLRREHRKRVALEARRQENILEKNESETETYSTSSN